MPYIAHSIAYTGGDTHAAVFDNRIDAVSFVLERLKALYTRVPTSEEADACADEIVGLIASTGNWYSQPVAGVILGVHYIERFPW